MRRFALGLALAVAVGCENEAASPTVTAAEPPAAPVAATEPAAAAAVPPAAAAAPQRPADRIVEDGPAFCAAVKDVWECVRESCYKYADSDDPGYFRGCATACKNQLRIFVEWQEHRFIDEIREFAGGKGLCGPKKPGPKREEKKAESAPTKFLSSPYGATGTNRRRNP